MSTSKAVPPPYHHGDLRQSLIEVAGNIVASKGPAAVSLREVARIAGVSHNAPYRHFTSRDDLLAAVAAAGFRDLERQLKSAAARVDASQKLNNLGRAYLRFALANRGLYTLMFGGELDKAPYEDLRTASKSAAAQLEAGIASRGGPPAGATAAWAFVHGLAHLIIDKQIVLKDSDIANVFAAASQIFGGPKGDA